MKGAGMTYNRTLAGHLLILGFFILAVWFLCSDCQVTPHDVTPVKPFEDVRDLVLSQRPGNINRSLIKTLWFNEATIWPANVGKAAQDILKRGMNPGLGVRKLHKQGITGKGINVAIIDQNLLLDHPEFQGKIVKYFDTGTKQPADQGSMHGPAVTSLLSGENIGVAPGVDIYYAAAPSWWGDVQYFADALNWIVDENAKLPRSDKIRVVSVSAAPSGPGSPFTRNNVAWDDAVIRAAKAGILVLDCTSNRGMTYPCFYDLDDPDDVAKCTPGWPDMVRMNYPGQEFLPKRVNLHKRIYIPTSFRTSAEEYQQGEFYYQYTGVGGLSWSIPYLSGVLALGWQIRPELSNSQMIDLLFKSSYKTADGLQVINPEAFIAMVKSTTMK
jgi:serine protease AprX